MHYFTFVLSIWQTSSELYWKARSVIKHILEQRLKSFMSGVAWAVGLFRVSGLTPSVCTAGRGVM